MTNNIPMTDNQIPPETTAFRDEIKSCQVESCNRPLGRESRDLGFWTCHEHRDCTVCNQPVSAKEIQFCFNNSLPIKHARCLSLKDAKDGKIESQINLANFFRLLPEMTNSVEALSFDEKMDLLRRAQEFCAFISLHVHKDKKALKSVLDNERAQESAKIADTAKRETTAGRGTPAGRKKLNDTAKAINALTAVGVPYRDACISVYRTLVDKRNVPTEKAYATIIEAMVNIGSPEQDAVALVKDYLK
jgi:hypothetical protein